MSVNEWGNQCSFQPFNCNVNHFDAECPFYSYMNTLEEFARLYRSPRFLWNNTVATSKNDDINLPDNCAMSSTADMVKLEQMDLKLDPLTEVGLGNDVQLAIASPIVDNEQTDPIPEGLEQMQRRLMTQEAKQFEAAVAEITRLNIKIKGFHHVSRWQKHWQEVVEEQLMILDGQRVFGDRTQLALDDKLKPKSKNRQSAGSKSASQEGVLPNRRGVGIINLNDVKATVKKIKPNRPKKAPKKVSRRLTWSHNEDAESGIVWPSLLAIPNAELQLNIVGKDEQTELATIQQLLNNLDLRNPKANNNNLQVTFNRTLDRNVFGAVTLQKKYEYLNQSDLSEGEFPTINELHKFCKQQQRVQQPDGSIKPQTTFVYYFHNKGGCCSRKEKPVNPVASWREAMDTFMIEYPSICLRALLDGYVACGYNYAETRPTPHYRYHIWATFAVCVVIINFACLAAVIFGGLTANMWRRCSRYRVDLTPTLQNSLC
jgi:hypothetical protein